MHLKTQKKLYVKFIFGTFEFGLGRALWTAFVAAWEANGTLSLGYRKVGSAALNCTENQWQGQKPRQGMMIACSVLLTLWLHPSTATGSSLRQMQRGREQGRVTLKTLEKRLHRGRCCMPPLKKLTNGNSSSTPRPSLWRQLYLLCNISEGKRLSYFKNGFEPIKQHKFAVLYQKFFLFFFIFDLLLGKK